MEAQLRTKLEQILNESTETATSIPSLHCLSLARSLIVNPSSSEATISSVFETLAHSLHSDHNSFYLHNVLSLLSHIASHRPHLSPLVLDAVRSFSLIRTGNSTRTATEALSLLISIANSDKALVSSANEICEDLFVSLIFQPCLSARHWLLLNSERCCVRPSVLLTVLLGFTKDPYPYVRRASLDGLVSLGKYVTVEDQALVDGCYCRAVEMLSDMEDCIRSAAVRAVSEWGRLRIASIGDKRKEEWSDALFIQICSMVRDMSLEVRIETFDALGKIGMVSEDILLQTISKKVLPIMKGKKYPGQCFTKQIELPASIAAGVFVHGLEDEFCEVRRSACQSLRGLVILSAKFASQALNFLMDVLNDDSPIVRIQSLETMHHMATFDLLKVEETHMHMFLGTLVDSGVSIRVAARRTLQLIKLNDMAMFKLSVKELLESVEKYPQDEAEVFSVLFHIGQRHEKFAISFLKEASGQIELGCDGKLVFDSTKVAALLVLAISVPLAHRQCILNIPQRIFSYAVKLLGRASPALEVLAYLSHCIKSPIIPAVDLPFKEVEPGWHMTKCYTAENTHGVSEISDQTTWEPRELAIPLVDSQLNDHELSKSVELMLTKVKDIWQLLQHGCSKEVQMILRSWKEELATFVSSDTFSGVLAFVKQYLQVMKLMAKAWMYLRSPRKSRSYGKEELRLILGKLDRTLGEMRYRFTGSNKEQQLHILELVLLSCIMRLASIGGCSESATMKTLYSTVSCLDILHQEESIEPSRFVIELKKLLCDIVSYSPFLFEKLVDFFSPKQIVLCGNLKHLKAEVQVLDNHFENPLPYIAGLPVGIPLEISLYNIARGSRVWLKMTLYEELTEFVFLDLDQFEGSEEIRKLIFVAPFYRTPKASFVTLRACICLEYSSGDVSLVKRRGGPKHELTYLCKEKQVYLSMVVKQ